MLIKPPRFILCLLLGALMPFAYAPFNIFIIALLSPALLILIWSDSSAEQAFRSGYLFGLTMFGGGVYWLHISINMFGGVTLVGSILITAALVAFLSLYPALTGYISKRWLSKNEKLWMLIVVPAMWVLSEWCRSWIFTGFPWLNLSYSQSDTFFSAITPIFGSYGLSWLTIFIAALLALIYRSRGRVSVVGMVMLVLISITCLSLGKIDWTRYTGKTINVALIQAAIPQKLKWLPEMREKSLELYMNLSAPHWQDDLVVWPETAIPAYPSTIPDFIDKLTQLTSKRQTIFLSGIPSLEHDSRKYYNSVMMLAGQKTGWYHKHHLVPFGEYLPLKPVLGILLDFLQIPMSNFSPGNQSKPILTNDELSIGISICYEDTFGEEVIKALPDAEVLVNVSNDAWFGDSLAPHQHLQMARMRSMESGRYLLRATNTGISAIIDEKGKVLKQSPQFKATALSAEAKLFQGATPYVVWGNLPIITLALLFLLFSLLIQKRFY
ncbi:MAG: apolipoprotein N-acyltransferase [Gammaproteobacteria bacterium]|nr:apolipoprotein N-acyltransferase [Gammaproteobacteria bacterium]